MTTSPIQKTNFVCAVPLNAPPPPLLQKLAISRSCDDDDNEHTCFFEFVSVVMMFYGFFLYDQFFKIEQNLLRCPITEGAVGVMNVYRISQVMFLFPVYTGCGDGMVRVYDSRSGAQRRALRGHLSAVNNMQVKYITGFIDSRLWCYVRISPCLSELLHRYNLPHFQWTNLKLHLYICM